MAARSIEAGFAAGSHPLRWACAVLLYGVGDTVTTVAGLLAEETAEAGPVAGVALEHAGLPGYLLLKVGFLCGCYGVWSWLPESDRRAVPLALALVGAVVTAWNTAMLLT